MLFNRQKLLLSLINALNDRKIYSRRAIVKSLFLLKTEYFLDSKIKFYNFFPYKQGPFSQLCFSDLRKLKREGLINADERTITDKGSTYIKELTSIFGGDINHLLGRFSSEKEITSFVYAHYPQYTQKSELLPRKDSAAPSKGYFTVGYEGRDIDTFLDLLIQNNISMIIDVRRNPFSMNFCYTKKNLQKFLKDAGIEYVHIKELGVASEDRINLRCKEDYEALFSRYRDSLGQKQPYLDKVLKLGKNNRIAILCFEHDSASCHRREIAVYLRKCGCDVRNL